LVFVYFARFSVLKEASKDGSQNVTPGRCTFKSNNFGGILHPDGRKIVGKTKSGGFVSISQNNSIFAVQTKIGLVSFSFNSGNFACLLLGLVLEQEVSNLNGGGHDESFLGVHQMFTSNTEGSFTCGGDLETVGLDFMRNDTGFVCFQFSDSHGLTFVGDLGVLVEAFGAGVVDGRGSSAVAAIEKDGSRTRGGDVSRAVSTAVGERGSATKDSGGTSGFVDANTSGVGDHGRGRARAIAGGVGGCGTGLVGQGGEGNVTLGLCVGWVGGTTNEGAGMRNAGCCGGGCQENRTSLGTGGVAIELLGDIVLS